MSLKPGDSKNFQNLLRAAENNQLVLLECKDAKTGEYVAAICFANRHPGGDFEFVPVARMFAGNPYEELSPPELDEQEPTEVIGVPAP